ncbi:MAG TPA: hypothetical protein PLG34_13575 [Spirochaetota bacterium]|nr:hypothetical protein [Spirochaetota bacterium]
MEIKATLENVSYDLFNDKTRISLLTSEKVELSKYKEKDLNVSIKEYRNKRSMDANAKCWVLLQKMAEVLNRNKDDIYLEMLSSYGVFTHLIVKPNVVERIKSEWRTVKELGEVEVNGVKGIQLQCYFGSSTYDTKEMSVFIKGIINECEDLGIETMSPQELASMLNEWRK